MTTTTTTRSTKFDVLPMEIRRKILSYCPTVVDGYNLKRVTTIEVRFDEWILPIFQRHFMKKGGGGGGGDDDIDRTRILDVWKRFCNNVYIFQFGSSGSTYSEMYQRRHYYYHRENYENFFLHFRRLYDEVLDRKHLIAGLILKKRQKLLQQVLINEKMYTNLNILYPRNSAIDKMNIRDKT
ncbi:hypothetical protein PV327_011579, partial [Microctonus hyperodae]